RKHSITLFDAFKLSAQVEEIPPKTSSNIQVFIELLSRYSVRFQTGKFMADTFRELVDEIHFEEYIMSTYKSERAAFQRIENVEEFIQTLECHEKEDEPSSLSGFLEKLAITDILKNKGENTHSGVTLISFHSAKGLEFPVVFIVGVEEEIIPHKKSLLNESDLEEERRLFYVGITRSMKELYLTHTDTRVRYKKEAQVSPSRFLNEIPKQVVRKCNRFTKEGKEEAGEDDAKAFFANLQSMLNE
ncbi:MAG: 3'-5' exonuclease, partial [Nitrospinota bacterium]